MKFAGWCLLVGILGFASQAHAVEPLGTGTAALIGGDLTDPENDGDDSTPQGSGFNAVFDSNRTPTFAGEGAFNVFDNKVGAGDFKWVSLPPSSVAPVWVQARFAQPVRLMAFTMTSGNDSGGSRDPDRWRIQGSTDGTRFVDIFVYDNDGTSPFSLQSQVLLYRAGEDFQPPPLYTTLRFQVESTVNNNDLFQLNEIEFFDRVPGAVTLTTSASCTLADAIRSANTATAIGGCAAGSTHADIIELGSNLASLTPDNTNSTALLGARAVYPDVLTGITLRAGAGTQITGGGASCSPADTQARFFNVLGTQSFLLLDSIRLEGGCARAGGAVAVSDQARLLLYRSTLVGNKATALNNAALGGAVWAALRQAGDQPSVVIENTSFQANQIQSASTTAQNARGGAVYADANSRIVAVRDSTFLANTITAETNGATGSSVDGGAVFAGAPIAEMVRTQFSDNTALAGAGTTQAGTAAGGAVRGFVTVAESLRFERNIATGGPGDAGTGAGGAASGGALNGGFGRVRNALFVDNRAIAGSGVGGGTATGGAIRSADAGESWLDLSFDANQAVGGAATSGTPGVARGGAVFTNAALTTAANWTIANSLATPGLDVNFSAAAAEGGAWYVGLSGAVTAHHLTIVNNRAGNASAVQGTAQTQGAGLAVFGSMALSNSALQDNVLLLGASQLAQDCTHIAGQQSLGYNRVQAPGACSFAAVGDVTNTQSPVLALADYGCIDALPGAVCLKTLPMRNGSNWLDGGACTVSLEAADARGQVRPVDVSGVANVVDGCDIGAFEATDGDGDGAITVDDNCPTTPNPTQADGDVDGLGDACDACFSRYAPRLAGASTGSLRQSAPAGALALDVDAENGQTPDTGISYAFASGATPTQFVIDAANGRITRSATGNLGAVGTQYILNVVATDCERSATISVHIAVTADPPDALFGNGFE